MKRYDYQVWENDDGALEGWLSEGENGDYVEYEEARLIEVDRDIKAANLQLLVEKVLAWDSALATMDAGDPPTNADMQALAQAEVSLVDLARSLKQ